MDKIKRDLGISILGCLELSTLARDIDPTPWTEHSGKLISLAKLTEVYVRNLLDKPKRLQRGNWEQRLQPPMQECELDRIFCVSAVLISFIYFLV